MTTLRGAMEHIEFGMAFAYKQGLHEFGYDPVATVRAALTRTAEPSEDVVERVARAIYGAEADSEDVEIGSKEWSERLARAALSAAPQGEMQPSAWQPIETAPRDGTAVLVRFRDDVSSLQPSRSDLEAWNGIAAVMRNRGDSLDWSFAAPVGHGGFPDEWLVGWKPIPAMRAAAPLQAIEESERSARMEG